MRKKTITIYNYNELEPHAQERARNLYRKNHLDECYFLEEILEQEKDKLLAKNKITEQTSKTYYSLRYCQGDGVMFEGVFEWKGYTVTIKHSGHYYHKYSKSIEIVDRNGNYPKTDEPLKAFEDIYLNMCDELERVGYRFLEDQQSDKNIASILTEEDYNFTKDGNICY